MFRYKISNIIFKRKLYVFIICILFGIIISNRILLANNLDFGYDFEYSANVYALDSLSKEKLLNPEFVAPERIRMRWKQNYVFKIDQLPEYHIGYFRQYERGVNIGERTINFLYDIHNSSIFDNSYSLYIETWSQHLEGIYLGREVYSNKNSGLSVDVYAKLLHGLDLQRSYYNGELYFKQGELNIKGYRSSLYSKVSQETNLNDINYYSYGYSMDLDIFWAIDDKRTLSLFMKDLYNQLYWKDVFTKVGKYDTDNVEMDGGNLIRLPSFIGKYYYQDYKTNLTPDIKLEYSSPQMKLGLHYRNEVKPYMQYKFIEKELYNSTLSIYLGFYGDQISSKLTYRTVKIELSADKINPAGATSLTGTMSFDYKF